MTLLELLLELRKRDIILSVTSEGLLHYEGGEVAALVPEMKRYKPYIRAFAKGQAEVAGICRRVTMAREKCLEARACLWLSLDCMDRAAWTDSEEGFIGLCVFRRPLG